MEQYVIKGGNPLVGEVEIGGAKNAALAIISAAVMTDETVTIENLPNVRDINVLLNAISDIGAKVDRYSQKCPSFPHTSVQLLSVTDVLQRIDCSPSDVDFKMHMWSCGTSGTSAQCDRFPLLHLLADFHQQLAVMCIPCTHPVREL